MLVCRCSSILMKQVLYFCVSDFPNKGLMLFNVFPMVNTWHALEFSVFLMVETLTSIRCHLLATEIGLNAVFSTARTLNAQ